MPELNLSVAWSRREARPRHGRLHFASDLSGGCPDGAKARYAGVAMSYPVIIPRSTSMKLTTLKTLALASLLAVSLPPAMVVMSASPSFAASAIDSLDPDKDGTVDLC